LNIDRTYPEFFEKMGFCIENNLNLQKICKEKGIESKFNEEEAQKIINSYN
ncbi:4-hydroxy-2-ketovalerate aldolase, partial [Campylobacter upsaliensis]|nr:4-hydroxy-2-ketovalerate aldolase [Campylobacter upsaliensis]